MGPALGAIFAELYKQISWVNLKYNEFVVLFGTSAETVGVLNESAPAFFSYLQHVMFDSVMLDIARLLDPARTGKKKNLSLDALHQVVPPSIEAKIGELILTAKTRGAFCRDWRHRRLAHNDFDLLLAPKDAKPLEPATREKIRLTLEAVSDVMNAVLRNYADSVIGFDSPVPGAGSAQYLVGMLKKAVDARDKQSARKLRRLSDQPT